MYRGNVAVGPLHTGLRKQPSRASPPPHFHVVHRFKLPLFTVAPDKTFQCGTPRSATASYWYFTNLQATVQQAMLSHTRCDGTQQASDTCAPVLVDTWVKPFPWKAFDLDVGSILAGVILRMLLIFAFIQPFQGCVKSIVTEKELRLREGMALLGLRGAAYWGSWFLTHWGTPGKLFVSPSELLASPSELLTSPSELSASPSELLASPSEL
jgi:hypothetical protein